jgi:hypothetical protein
MLATVLLAVIGGPLLSYDAAELHYFDPQGSDRTSLSYLSHGSGSIPLELGEKLLTKETHVLGADSLIAVVNQEYDSARDQIRSACIRKVWHCGARHSTRANSKTEGRAASLSRPLVSLLATVGSRPCCFRRHRESNQVPREYEVTSQPYNRIEELEGYSVLRIRIADGEGLFGKKVAVLQIRRHDYSKERARFHHVLPIPLPYKEYRAFTVVTNTEVDFVESLKQRASGVVVRYWVPSHRIGEQSYREDFWAGMAKVVSQF